jgi:hypothetical protein
LILELHSSLSDIASIFGKGLEAHNAGDLTAAEQIYKETLAIQPDHCDANHNLGILLVDQHQSNNALPFLMTAFEGHSEVEQFWVSYINALINLDKLDSANEFIGMARKAGFSGEKFDHLSERTLSPVLLHAKGKFLQAQDGHYLNFLRALHESVYEGYFEIGTRNGNSLVFSQSPSVAIDPFFQLNKNPIGKKDFCLMFQETSDSFFENRLPKLSGLKCQLAFIDGMHLFECALKDFINLAKISSEKSLFLFHDPMPWTYRMATRNNKALDRGEAWTGDIWKLVPILIDAGMKDNINLLTSSPSGLLAIFSPDKKIITKLEERYDEICAQWLDVELNEDTLLEFYETGVFVKPEVYLRSLEKISFGDSVGNISREWVSQ